MVFNISRLYCSVKQGQFIITNLSKLKKNILKCPRVNITRNSFISATGFNEYEEERRKQETPGVIPEHINFFTDIIEFWASKETQNERKGIPAFWYIEENGKELKWTFQELAMHSRKAAKVLQSICGLKKGDRVIIILPKIPELWIIMLAIFQIGAVASIGTMQLKPKDIHYRINSFGAKYIIASNESAENIDTITYSCPSLKRKILCSKNKKMKKGWLNFNTFYEEAEPLNYCAKTKATDPLIVFFTSGTTGNPKIIQHSMDSILTFRSMGYYWMDLTPNHLMWNINDLGWAKAAWGSLFVPWSVGAGVFIHNSPRFDAERTLKTLQEYPITHFCAAPTAYRMMIQLNLKSYSFPHLWHCMSSGEPLNPAANEMWYQQTGFYIHEGLGQSETPLLCATYRCIKKKLGSMGKPPPGINIAIIDKDNNELNNYQEGELAVKIKPYYPIGLFKEYLNNPEKTAAAFRGDYYITGDRAYRDEEGYYWFIARNDDVIISSGYTIGPFEVESALQEHSAVIESAVVSSPDPIRGEIVKAFVILNDKFLQTDKNEMIKILQEHVKSITSPYKYPRKIEFVTELPKTVSGKIQRKVLHDKEWSGIRKT